MECVLARLEVQPDVARVPHVVRGSALAAKLEVVHLEAVVADGLVRKVVWEGFLREMTPLEGEGGRGDRSRIRECDAWHRWFGCRCHFMSK